VIFKSPLTGTLFDASSGGYWGAFLKRAGYDGLVIEGKAEEPVYLSIDESGVSIREAGHLWGLDTFETQQKIKEEIGDPRARVACIGPAGERGVLFACIINDEGRAPGRGGNGAVMGAKNLKAIAVSGNRKVRLHDESGFRSLVKKLLGGEWRVVPGWDELSPYGTAMVLDNAWPSGDIPVKNWSRGEWKEGCLNLGGRRMADTLLTKRPGCYACHIKCARWVTIKEGPYSFDGPGPEYETLASLGTMTMIDNLEAVAYAGHLCNLYGIDTISCGTTIAFAMEARERGLLGKEHLEGLDLRWGNAEALVEAVRCIGEGRGIGKLLGLGMRRAAEEIGGDAHRFAYHVKGLEAPMHDPRCFHSLAVTYATSPRGACHLHGASHGFEGIRDAMPEWGLTEVSQVYVNDESKSLVAALAQDRANIENSMVICCFLSFYHGLTAGDFATMLNLATGFDYDAKELKLIGERITQLHRTYNIRAGIGPEQDRLPERALEPMKEGGHAGKVPDMGMLLPAYYRLRGWTERGEITREALERVGLTDVAADLFGEASGGGSASR